MDYLSLLKKYMALVIYEESISFLDCAYDSHPIGLTKEELHELRGIEKEVEKGV